MSERDLRSEVAELARDVRDYVRREGLQGGGELLAQGVARAGAGAATEAVAERGEPDSPSTLATPTPERDLFGMPAPSPAPAARMAPAAPKAVASDIVLPPFADDLWPSALDAARGDVLSASLAVLDDVATLARACRKCGLCETRTNAVPGVGSAASGIVFVGEAPGADEDARGEPFVGRAGELLTKMIQAMDEKSLIPGVRLSRETVYICNVLKCRPPENRNPLPHEIESCSPYLVRQLDALKPRIICCLGKFAAELLLGVKGTIASMRGKTYRYQGAKLIVTYHPAYCLRSPSAKRPVWEDLQRLAQEYLTD